MGAMKRNLVHHSDGLRLGEMRTCLVLEVRVVAMVESILIGVGQAFFAFFHLWSNWTELSIVEHGKYFFISFDVEILRILCF